MKSAQLAVALGCEIAITALIALAQPPQQPVPGDPPASTAAAQAAPPADTAPVPSSAAGPGAPAGSSASAPSSADTISVTDIPSAPIGTDTKASGATLSADQQAARELPLDAEPFDVRVHRRTEEYRQRHQQRQHQMASYESASTGDPGLERYADPRKVQLELEDELDRSQTCEELAADYAERAQDVESKKQALREFLSKRKQKLDELGKQGEGGRRQDLEIALANLSLQPASPEALAEMREVDRRLSQAERMEKQLPAELAQNQQETTDAAQELEKLEALKQHYEKESKVFTADSLSAQQNRLRLADKLEYYVVRAQAEDELEQGRKAMDSVEHLAASPEVEHTLNSGATAKSDAGLEQLRDCLRKTNDVKGCREKIRQE